MAVGVRVDMGNGVQRLQNAFSAARRLLGWLRSALRRFTDHPRFQSLLDKIVLLPTLSLLFLLLMLAAIMSGGRRLIRRLTGQNKMRNT